MLGSIGDMIYFHGSSNTPLIVDIAQDIRALNDIALLADKSGNIRWCVMSCHSMLCYVMLC